MRLTVSFASVCGVRATLKRRADAAAVTGSRVCAESIVEMSTSNGSSWLSSAIFSTAGCSRWPMARASTRMTACTVVEGSFFIQRDCLEGSDKEVQFTKRFRRLASCCRVFVADHATIPAVIHEGGKMKRLTLVALSVLGLCVAAQPIGLHAQAKKAAAGKTMSAS